MTKIPSVEKTIEYLRFAMREGCNCKGCEDDRANIGEHCVIRQALTADRTALLTELKEWSETSTYNLIIEEYLPKVKSWTGGYDRPFDEGYAQAKVDLQARINSLINPDGV